MAFLQNSNTIYVILLYLISTCYFVDLNKGTQTGKLTDKSDFSEENTTVIVYKCCAERHILFNRKCVEYDGANFDVEIYKSNDTHYWLWEDVKIQIKESDPCKYGRIALEPEVDEDDSWIVLSNGSLYLRNITEILDTTQYCLENLNGTIEKISALLCISKQKASIEGKLRGSLQIISMFFLFLLAYCKFREKKFQYDSKKCLVMMFLTMAIAYLVLSISSFLSNSSFTCSKILWILRYYFTMVYIIWQTIFVVELYRNLCTKKPSYFFWYLAVAYGIPILMVTLFLSLLGKFPTTPLEQDGGENSMLYYLIFYYIPTGLLCLFCVGLGSCIKLDRLMRQNSKQRSDSKSFEEEEKKFYRRCCFLFWVIISCWLCNLVLYILSVNITSEIPQLLILIILTDSLGIICALLFIKREWFQKNNISNNRHNTDITNEILNSTNQELVPIQNGRT